MILTTVLVQDFALRGAGMSAPHKPDPELAARLLRLAQGTEQAANHFGLAVHTVGHAHPGAAAHDLAILGRARGAIARAFKVAAAPLGGRNR